MDDATRLVAYVAGEPVDLKTLREQLARELPEYMIPSAFGFVEMLPRSANNKLDRRALASLSLVDERNEAAASGTLSPTEEVVAGIWQEVLGVERVGQEDSFFALGGHSLLATQAVARVHRLLGVDVPLRTLFELPMLRAFAARLDALRALDRPRLPELRVYPRTQERLPLSYAQQRLWVVEQLAPGSAAYVMPVVARLTGALDVARLESALIALVARHESLRTTFGVADGTPFQRVATQQPYAVSLFDLRGAADEAAWRDQVRARLLEPFDLENGPLLRAALYRIDDDAHILALAMHHIVSDGWSMGLLVGELAAAYRGDQAAALQVQYADYALWQRESLQGKTLDGLLDYWRAQLADLPTLELPTKGERPARPTGRGGMARVTVSEDVVRALRALCRREGSTLFMALLAAFNVLLARYSGQSDIAVGTPVANRNRAELESLIGLFVNMLVMRCRVAPEEGFAALLRNVRETALAAYDHQELPFEKLVAELAPDRDLGKNPLFQVSFVLQQTPAALPSLDAVTVEPADGAVPTLRFDLELSVKEHAEGLQCAFLYDEDLFDSAVISNMARQFVQLLQGIVADPACAVSRLPLLSGPERAEILRYRGGTAQCPVPGTLHALVEAQAARRPDAIAVTGEGLALSYATLNARANQLAHRLRELGVGPDSIVAVCFERVPNLAAVLLGILKAGGAYLPIDLAYPRDRLKFMLEDAACHAVVVLEGLEDHLPETSGVPVVRVDAAWQSLASYAAENPVSGATVDSLAYVIYTSGSTGQPKGTLITHRNVVRLFTATEAWYGFDETDVWSMFHSYAFDFSVWEIWGALIYGGRLAVVPYITSRSPEQTAAFLAQEGVTVLNQTPSAFRQLSHAILRDVEPGAPWALRHVIFGGEALDIAGLRAWFERYGDRTPRLVNMYGITETTVHVTYRPLTLADACSGAGSVIGEPIPDLTLYVLDPAQQLAPIGVAGELYVGGPGLARGYLNRPELTAERFIADPFSDESGARLYRSGDLARRTSDGELEYLGRIDHQVKLRGFRVELGEIESALCQYPGVREATVLVREDTPGDQRLVAYVVSVNGFEPSEARKHLLGRLPEYMAPSAYVRLDALPLTPNGKVDRRALPAPAKDRADEESYVAPRNDAEQRLATIGASVLSVERLGVLDNFFELGGHSLLATQFVSRIREAFGVEVPLRVFFEAPTVAALADAIATRVPTATEACPPAEGPVTIRRRKASFMDQIEALEDKAQT